MWAALQAAVEAVLVAVAAVEAGSVVAAAAVCDLLKGGLTWAMSWVQRDGGGGSGGGGGGLYSPTVMSLPRGSTMDVPACTIPWALGPLLCLP